MTEDMHSATPASGSLTRAYARYLKLEKNYSPNTIAAYLTDIGHLVTFSHERGVSIDRIELSDLQQTANTPTANISLRNEETEKQHILEALRQTGNNKSRAAQMLGIDRKTLYNKLKLYNLSDSL